MESKSIFKSKTFWFNIFAAMFAVLSSYTHLLQSYLPDGGYLVVLMFVAAGNVYLRTITTMSITKKPNKQEFIK